MAMESLREIGKYVVLSTAIYGAFSFCEQKMYSSVAYEGRRQEVRTIKDFVNALPKGEQESIAKFERRFSSPKSKEAEVAYGVISTYAKTYERIAEEYGIPPKLALAQAAIENSDYRSIKYRAKSLGITLDRAYLTMKSRANAKGPFMMKKLAAQEIGGLVVSRLKDERENPVESTRGAMRYLKRLTEEFGSLELAYTAYWMGPTTLRENGPNKKYFHKILAMGKIFESPHEYGVNLQDRKKDSDFRLPWTKKAKKKIVKESPRRNVPYKVAYRKH